MTRTITAINWIYFHSSLTDGLVFISLRNCFFDILSANFQLSYQSSFNCSKSTKVGKWSGHQEVGLRDTGVRPGEVEHLQPVTIADSISYIWWKPTKWYFTALKCIFVAWLRGAAAAAWFWLMLIMWRLEMSSIFRETISGVFETHKIINTLIVIMAALRIFSNQNTHQW